MRNKITRTITLISLLTIMTVPIPLGYAYEWSPDMRLTWNVESDWMPSLAQASDGKIWVVWHSYRTGNADVFYKVYDASQAHPWSSETRLTTDPNDDLTPLIMQARDGKIWVVWSTNRTGNYDIFYKVYDGVSWSPDENLTTDSNVDELPSIMQTRDEKIWVVWSTNRTGNYDIFYKTYNGIEWSSETPVTFLAGDDWDPSIVQAADGKIWVVWVRNENIFYKTSSDNGTTWSSDNGLVTDPSFDRHPSIMQDVDGKIWVVWDSDRISEQNDIYYRVYDGFWSFDKRLTTDLADDFMPSIMQAMNQTLWIAWASSRLNNYDIYYRTTEVPQPHDVTIFSVTPSEVAVYQGQTVSIEVVAQNHGTNAETFTVRCYANSTLIGLKTISLAPGQLYPITFPWNTSSTAIGTHTINAEASVVPNETDTVDNTLVDGTVFVTIPGDVDGDGDIDPDDFYIFSGAYGTSIGDSAYKPECDIDRDGDIDPDDFYIFAGNYGKTI